jgi:hypothetical protein
MTRCGDQDEMAVGDLVVKFFRNCPAEVWIGIAPDDKDRQVELSDVLGYIHQIAVIKAPGKMHKGLAPLTCLQRFHEQAHQFRGDLFLL